MLGNGTPIGGYPAFDKQNTLASWLQDAGYHTIQIGKFLNGYPKATNRTEVPPGWDEWYACLDSSENNYFNYTLNENGTLVHYGSGGKAIYKTTSTRRKAVDAISDRGAARRAPASRSSAPRLHRPAPAGDPGRRGTPHKFRRRKLPRAREVFNEGDVSDKPRFIRNAPYSSRPQIRKINGRLPEAPEALRAVDEGVSQVIDALASQGELDNTYVVFISDNGFFFGEHRLARASSSPIGRAGAAADARAGDQGRRRSRAGRQHRPRADDPRAGGATPDQIVDGRSLVPYAQDPADQAGRSCSRRTPSTTPRSGSRIGESSLRATSTSATATANRSYTTWCETRANCARATAIRATGRRRTRWPRG